MLNLFIITMLKIITIELRKNNIFLKNIYALSLSAMLMKK
jgi:hypothetical protein